MLLCILQKFINFCYVSNAGKYGRDIKFGISDSAEKNGLFVHFWPYIYIQQGQNRTQSTFISQSVPYLYDVSKIWNKYESGLPYTTLETWIPP